MRYACVFLSYCHAAHHPALLTSRRYRQANAGDLFLGVYLPTRTLIGIIMSTRSSSPVLTHSSMTSHDPKGSSVCVHGICIRKEYRRRGIATDLLREYVQQVSKIQGIERILLLCHEELQRLYVRAGFELVGKSEVVHGSKEWWEMRRILGETGGIDMDGFDVVSEHGGRTASPPSMQAMADIMAAVAQSSSSSRSRPTPKLLSSYPNLQDVIDTDGSETKRNKFKLVCVRDGCGSLILQAETAELVEEPSVEVRRVAVIWH
jgi:GNAT superfamily N-acetyltransferase